MNSGTAVKVGIVGFGGAGIAQLGHFSLIRDCQVTAIYDPKPGGVARARSMAPTVFATDKLEEFMRSEINTIAVCSPDGTHADYITAAIKARLHVICEKPLTDSLDGCRRILDADTTRGGVVVAVQHQMRFVPVHVKMKEIIRSGHLGRIHYIEGYYVHNLTRRASQYDEWRFQENATPLVYAGCHFVDLFRWLLDDEVEEVIGMANNIAFPDYPESDLNVVLLRFKSGVIGKVVVAFGAGRPQDHSVRVYGTEMSIENNLLFSKAGDHTIFEMPHKRRQTPAKRAGFGIRGRGYRSRLMPSTDYLLARVFERLMKWRRLSPDYSISSFPMRLYPHTLAVRASLENFVGAITGEARLNCSVKDAARTVATCLAGVEAYRTGKIVKVRDFWLPELD